MTWHQRPTDDDRRRKLQSYSRFAQTPRQLVIELNADGTDYGSLGSFQEEEFNRNLQQILAILQKAPQKLPCRDIRRGWQEDKVPDASTLYRQLDRAAAQGLLAKDGQGTKSAPYRYWLPAKEDEWRQDPLAMFHMPELFQS